MLKPLITFLLLLSIANLGFAQEEQRQYMEVYVGNLLRERKDFIEEQRQYMKVYPYKISVNDSLCYQVRKGSSRRDTTSWEPFCGVLDNFYFMEGYERTVIVKECNPHADTMFVIKTLARDAVGHFPQKKDLRKEEKRRKEWREKNISQSFSEDKKAQYMTVLPYRVKLSDTKFCYQVRPGYGKGNAIPWELFCGVFENFEFEEGKEHTLLVKKYDPNADTMQVVKIIK